MTRECGTPANPPPLRGHAACRGVASGVLHTQSSETRLCSPQMNVSLDFTLRSAELLVPSSYMPWWVFCQTPFCWFVGLIQFSPKRHLARFSLLLGPRILYCTSVRTPPPLPCIRRLKKTNHRGGGGRGSIYRGEKVGKKKWEKSSLFLMHIDRPTCHIPSGCGLGACKSIRGELQGRKNPALTEKNTTKPYLLHRKIRSTKKNRVQNQRNILALFGNEPSSPLCQYFSIKSSQTYPLACPMCPSNDLVSPAPHHGYEILQYLDVAKKSHFFVYRQWATGKPEHLSLQYTPHTYLECEYAKKNDNMQV